MQFTDATAWKNGDTMVPACQSTCGSNFCNDWHWHLNLIFAQIRHSKHSLPPFFFNGRTKQIKKCQPCSFFFRANHWFVISKAWMTKSCRLRSHGFGLSLAFKKMSTIQKTKTKSGFLNNAKTMFRWKAPRRSKSNRCLMIEAVSNWRNTHLSSVENDIRRNIEGTRQAEKIGRC